MSTSNEHLKSETSVSVLSDVAKSGAFVRKPSTYRDWISATQSSSLSPSPSASLQQDASTSAPAKFYPPAKGRYTIYASYACPWACRVLTVLYAKNLQNYIDVIVVHPMFQPTKPDVDNHVGWTFQDFDDSDETKGQNGTVPVVFADPVVGAKTIRELYEKTCPADREMPSRFTVPILFDKETKQVVNNESSEIIQMFNKEFNEILAADGHAETAKLDFYPEDIKDKIDEVNEWTYESVNNGVYKCGFARSQEAYDEAMNVLFPRLEEIDQRLAKQRYLAGDGKRITLADIRLVQTFIRFDPVYVVHFKCSRKCLREFKNISDYMVDVVQSLRMVDKNGVGRTAINNKHIRYHYFMSHEGINPHRIVAQSPTIDFARPHGREALSQ